MINLGSFLLRRLLQIGIVLLLLTTLVFFLVQMLPGDLAHVILGGEATPEQYATVDHLLGLDRPATVRYFEWLSHVIRGDWGQSLTKHTSVYELVMHALVNSIKLASVALVLLIPAALVGGIVAALHEGSAIDRLISIGGALLNVIPEFVSGIVLIVIFGIKLRWLPLSAQPAEETGLWDTVRHLLLPALPIAFAGYGYISSMARAGTLEVLGAPYLRTAVLKGLSPWQVITRHVLRNALPTTVSLAVTQAGFMMAGVVIVEQLFSYPGLGKLLLDSSTSHDVPTLQAGVFVGGLVVMSMTLLADILLGIMDPRVRLWSAR